MRTTEPSAAFLATMSAEKVSTAISVPVSSSGIPTASESWSMFSARHGVNDGPHAPKRHAETGH